MSKVVQISILGKISGNVNADEVIGTRVALKKMYSTTGEVLPFVSARAVKYSIRLALKDLGFEIDPFITSKNPKDALRLADSGDPKKYIDNDIFGYMKTKGREERADTRQAPIALSYFKALRDTPIKAEFAARFPRNPNSGDNPVPFEVEVAEFIGRLNCIIYDYVGKDSQGKNIVEDEERKKRIRAFCNVLLTPKYVLPRRTNSLCVPEYISALIVLSQNGVLPVYQYLDYDFEKNQPDIDKLKLLVDIIGNGCAEVVFINYLGQSIEVPPGITGSKVEEVVEKITNFLV
jgi:CRISPR-associated protein Cst2